MNTKPVPRKWTPYMERIMAKYYPEGGPRVTLAYLKDRIPGFPYKIKDLYVKAYRMGISGNHGHKTQFKKGMTSWCKGMKMEVPQLKAFQYKKGHTSPREVPLGTLKLQSSGYWWIKTAMKPTKWEQWHKVLWIEANGPIPEGKILWFKDNNPENCCLENIQCGTRGEMLKLKVLIHNPRHQKQIA